MKVVLLIGVVMLTLVGCATSERQYFSSTSDPRFVPYAIKSQNRAGYKLKGPVQTVKGSSYVYSAIEEDVERVHIGKKFDVVFDEDGRVTQGSQKVSGSENNYVNLYYQNLLIKTEYGSKNVQFDENKPVKSKHVTHHFYNKEGDLIKSKSKTSCMLLAYKGDILFTKPCLGKNMYTRTKRSEHGNILEVSQKRGQEVEVLMHGEERTENGQLKYTSKTYRDGKLIVESSTLKDERGLIVRQEVNQRHILSDNLSDKFSTDANGSRKLINVEFDQYGNPTRMEYEAIETSWDKDSTGRKYVELREYTYF